MINSSSGFQGSSHMLQGERGAELICFPFSVVTCPAQKHPEHGHLVCNPLGKFTYNSSCSISCADGYLPSSTEATWCMSSGEWSTPLPKCNGKFLSESIEHSSIHLSPPWFPGGSDGKASACNAGDPGLIPGWGRSPGEGNGNPLQYSCLENSIDRGAL